MPTGIEELITAAAAVVEGILIELLDVGSELTKQPKVDAIKAAAQAAAQPGSTPSAQRGQG